jgi:hypothetical protein
MLSSVYFRHETQVLQCFETVAAVDQDQSFLSVSHLLQDDWVEEANRISVFRQLINRRVMVESRLAWSVGRRTFQLLLFLYLRNTFRLARASFE